MNKYSAFFSELNKLPGVTKEEAVREFTNGRTSSLRDLAESELHELAGRLRIISAVISPGDDGELIDEHDADARKRMIGKIFYYAHEIGLIRTVTKLGPRGMVKRKDYSQVYAWIEKYGYLHKRINDYQTAELPKLVSQMESRYKSWLSGL